MRCFQDIINLADEKIMDAQCLLSAGRLDGAYYIAGYNIELLLKAKVCKTLGIDNFFHFGNRAKLLKDESNITRTYRVHDLDQLMILSGIFSLFQQEISVNTDFRASWSIIKDWNEGHRYLTGKTQRDVQDLLTSINKFWLWIQNHL